MSSNKDKIAALEEELKLKEEEIATLERELAEANDLIELLTDENLELWEQISRLKGLRPTEKPN